MKINLRKFSPPSWDFLRAANLFIFAMCGTLVFVADEVWVKVVDAFLAGFAFGSIMYQTMIIAYRKHFDEMSKAFNQMVAMNQQLIAGQVKVVIEQIEQDLIHEDDDGERPSLH